jgi:hypothetical protein
MRRRSSFSDRRLFWKVLLVVAICANLLGGVLLGWKNSPFLLPLASILIMMFFDRVLDSLLSLVFNGCWPEKLNDQLAGELVKARLMKASSRFDEALVIVNATLRRLPRNPEALFLKAQIMSEGFADYAAAKACLQQIVRMEAVHDENIRRWAEGMLAENKNS